MSLLETYPETNNLISHSAADLHGALGHIEEGHVQGTTPKVVDQDVVDVLLLVQPVGHGGGGRLFQHTHHLRGGQGGQEGEPQGQAGREL